MKKIVFIAALALQSLSAAAQTTVSTIAASPIATSNGVARISNDYYGGLVAVVWNGDAPGIYYRLPSGVFGTIPLPGGIVDPDICISRPATLNGDVFLLVIGTTGSNYVLYRYKLVGNAFTPWGTYGYGTIIGPFTSTMNIDANINGDYAFVLGYGNGTLRVMRNTYADLVAGNAPTQAGFLANSGGGVVDICVGATGTYQTTNVHLCYRMLNGTEIRTAQIPFAGGTFSTPVVVAPAISGVVYNNPRIAAPHANPCTGVNDLFSIVYNRTAGGITNTYQSSNDPNNVQYTTNLTAGVAPFPTPAMNNVSDPPVITFEKGLMSMGNCYAGTAVAWGIPSNGVSTLYGQRVNTNNTPWGPTEYLTISPAAATNARHLAISGSDAGMLLLSYFSGNQIFIKEVSSWGPTF